MPAPLAHISGLQNAVTVAGAAGMKAVLMSKWEPQPALELIEVHRVTVRIGPRTFLGSLHDARAFSPDRVSQRRLLSRGGARVARGGYTWGLAVAHEGRKVVG